MKVRKTIEYNFNSSLQRIQSILDSSGEFDNVVEVPNSDSLSYKNGYYFNCYAIFIDIRGSSQLPTQYNKPVLAKIYRAYISEIVALFQSSENCKEINIVGDCVWGVYRARYKDDINEVYHAAYAASSIVDVLNYKLCRKNIDPIKIGIGIDKGNALMIQAGLKGSGINDVIYMGKVVNNASNLCGKGGKQGNGTIVISESVYDDLKEKRTNDGGYVKNFFNYNKNDIFYHASIFRVDMNNWLKDQQKKNPCTKS